MRSSSLRFVTTEDAVWVSLKATFTWQNISYHAYVDIGSVAHGENVKQTLPITCVSVPISPQNILVRSFCFMMN